MSRVVLVLCCVLVVTVSFVGSADAHRGKCAAVKCAKPTNPCREARCNPATGSCYTVRRKDGALCADKNKCTVNSKCLNGVCVGVPKVCKPPANPTKCAERVCILPTGECRLTPKNEGEACHDGRPGTFNDKCVAGKCVGIPKKF